MIVDEISDELFEGLSEDAYTASYELLKRVEKKFLSSLADEASYSTACGVLEAFYELNSWKVPSRVSASNFALAGLQKAESIDEAIEKTRATWRLQYEGYRNQIMGNRSDAVKRAAKSSMAAISAGAFGYTILTKEEKGLIHSHIEKIRKIIEASKLEDRKKNALLDALANLARDVNRNGTRTDRFFAFASELGFCLGDFAKKAKPLFDEVKAILKIVTKARAREENIQLPSNGEILSLPEPDQNSSGVA
jgi:hypothetical protein